MQLFVIGSLNIDDVYHVPHFATAGESVKTLDYEVFPGGRGLNQAIAVARAGGEAHLGGSLGPDGLWLRELAEKEGIDTSRLQVSDTPNGRAIIQVNPQGENSIIVHPGANGEITGEHVEGFLSGGQPGDFLLLQNDSSGVPEAMRYAKQQGVMVLYNAAPYTEEVKTFPLELLDYLIVNETEGEALSGESDPAAMTKRLRELYPNTEIVLTLGEHGCRYSGKNEELCLPAPAVKPVDTTGAGDTFIGYFAVALSQGKPIVSSIELAIQAASLSVTRPGAATSIPRRDEVAT